MHTPATRLSPHETHQLGNEVEAWAAKRRLEIDDGAVDAEIRRRLRALVIEPELIDSELQRVLLAMSEAGEARR
jgi:hypothetical protein